MKKLISSLIAASFLVGCAAPTSYKPIASNGNELMMTNGHGALSSTRAGSDAAMHSTFKTQPNMTEPTFTLMFANTDVNTVEFDITNVKAFFNGKPVQLWTYDDKLAQIKRDKVTKQVLLAILTVAAVSAASQAGNSSMTSNSNGFIGNRPYSFNTTTSYYNPAVGFAAGVGTAAGAAYAFKEVDYDAEVLEANANSIVQQNTLLIGKSVTGQLIIKDCCDRPEAGKTDIVRFEVAVPTGTHVFEFQRVVAK